MGAAEFTTTAGGKTIGSAFADAVEQAAWEHGHGGYTGTIAEKHDYVVFDIADGKRLPNDLHSIEKLIWDAADGQGSAMTKLNALFTADAGVLVDAYMNKWGPAVAIPLSGKHDKVVKERAGLKGKRGISTWLFCGLASS